MTETAPMHVEQAGAEQRGTTVVVTGAAGAIGAYVADRLAANDSVDNLVAIDRRAADGVTRFDLLTDDLAELVTHADVLVHVAATPMGVSSDGDEAAADRSLAERMLDAAERVGVSHVVVMSSTMVYGAWPDNPMPLTEAAVIRPNPEFRFAMTKVEIEDLAERWAEEHDRTVTVVRAAPTMARGRQNTLALHLRNSAALRNSDGDAPAQFLHAEDLASAIEVLVTGKHGGTFNVAADGWLRPSEVIALRGVPETPVRVPSAVISAVSNIRRQFGGRTHPGLTAYLQHPWVVANDKLKALGWEPEFSNAEAYVAGHQPSRFDGVTAERRQELALGAAGAVVAASAVGLVSATTWAVKRVTRR